MSGAGPLQVAGARPQGNRSRPLRPVLARERSEPVGAAGHAAQPPWTRRVAVRRSRAGDGRPSRGRSFRLADSPVCLPPGVHGLSSRSKSVSRWTEPRMEQGGVWPHPRAGGGTDVPALCVPPVCGLVTWWKPAHCKRVDVRPGSVTCVCIRFVVSHEAGKRDLVIWALPGPSMPV